MSYKCSCKHRFLRGGDQVGVEGSVVGASEDHRQRVLPKWEFAYFSLVRRATAMFLGYAICFKHLRMGFEISFRIDELFFEKIGS